MTWDRDTLNADRKVKLDIQAQDEELHRISLSFLKGSYAVDYCYQWDWAGFPILNMPEDVMTDQEILFRCKPTVVIETGVAWGGVSRWWPPLCPCTSRTAKSWELTST